MLRDRSGEVLAAKGEARIVAATGASQFEFLEALTSAPGIDWRRVEVFTSTSMSAYPFPTRQAFASISLNV